MTEPILISISQDVSIISVTEITDEVNIDVINLPLMKNMKRVGNKLYQGTIHCIPHQMHILMHNDYYHINDDGILQILILIWRIYLLYIRVNM